MGFGRASGRRQDWPGGIDRRAGEWRDRRAPRRTREGADPARPSVKRLASCARRASTPPGPPTIVRAPATSSSVLPGDAARRLPRGRRRITPENFEPRRRREERRGQGSQNAGRSMFRRGRRLCTIRSFIGRSFPLGPGRRGPGPSMRASLRPSIRFDRPPNEEQFGCQCGKRSQARVERVKGARRWSRGSRGAGDVLRGAVSIPQIASPLPLPSLAHPLCRGAHLDTSRDTFAFPHP